MSTSETAAIVFFGLLALVIVSRVFKDQEEPRTRSNYIKFDVEYERSGFRLRGGGFVVAAAMQNFSVGPRPEIAARLESIALVA